MTVKITFHNEKVEYYENIKQVEYLWQDRNFGFVVRLHSFEKPCFNWVNDIDFLLVKHVEITEGVK